MEEKYKHIISTFTKIPAEQIGPATPIGRAAVKNSILLHRMYARLAEEGLSVENYTEIRVFSDLMKQGGPSANSLAGDAVETPVFRDAGPEKASAGIGIDIEELSSFPRTNDFRKEEFYKMNFTPSEIAYCILQPDPYASFAGLFTAKEAIVKADEQYRSKAFNSIGISHSPDGKPLFPGFNLSIAHAGAMAVAVAVSRTGDIQGREQGEGGATQEGPDKRPGWTSWISLLALLFSILALILFFTR